MASPPTSTTNTTDNDKKNFFDLPAELRNHIYEYVVDSEHASTACIYFSFRGRQLEKANGLHQASRQTRSEYLPILHQQRGVRIECAPMIAGFRPDKFDAWLYLFGAQALQHSRTLVFRHRGDGVRIVFPPTTDKQFEVTFRFEHVWGRRYRRSNATNSTPMGLTTVRLDPHRAARETVVQRAVNAIVRNDIQGAGRPGLSQEAAVAIVKALDACGRGPAGKAAFRQLRNRIM